MSYLAIYRRYRPRTFDEVIGQQHIVTTLSNQVKNNRVAHAYLFCGTRGTGKTSCAKILAKAVNCLNPVNGSPCNKCEVCKALDAGSLDVMEIDAASNNRVEEIRDLRDKVKYPPVTAKYKVYIIDEVHMLSDSAFNALLKTLEEPPAHAVFILATTEAHKLPTTILSRCLKFDFHLVEKDAVEKLISRIYNEAGKAFEKEAVSLIAEAGGGSVRDSLSIADLCVSLSDDELTYDDVLKALGAANPDMIFELCQNILEGDLGAIFEQIDRYYRLGKSMSVLTGNLTSAFRNMLLIKTASDAQKLLRLPSQHMERYKKLAGLAQQKQLLDIIWIFAAAENEIKNSLQPRLVMENAALKAADTQKKTANIEKEPSNEKEKEKEDVTPQTDQDDQEGLQEDEGDQVQEDEDGEYNEDDEDEHIYDDVDSELISLNQVDIEDAVVFDAGQAVTASMLWGRVITYFRSNGPSNLYSVLAEVSDVKYANGALTISLDSSDYEQIVGHLQKIKAVIESFSPDIRFMAFKKEDEQADFLKEAKKIQAMFSDIGIKIIK